MFDIGTRYLVLTLCEKEDFLETALNKRRSSIAFRQLRLPGGMIDFVQMITWLLRGVNVCRKKLCDKRQLAQVHGSGGSRLLAGNYELVESMAETGIK